MPDQLLRRVDPAAGRRCGAARRYSPAVRSPSVPRILRQRLPPDKFAPRRAEVRAGMRGNGDLAACPHCRSRPRHV